MFLRNAWCVAVWDHEITQNFLPRTIVGESIVFFRTGDGLLAALEDRCCQMVEARQRAIDRSPNAPQVDVPSDAPTIQARKLMASMIEAEDSSKDKLETTGA